MSPHRRIVTALIISALAVTGSALATAPAQAAPATDAATCELHIGKTSKSGSKIIGYGSITPACGSNGEATVVIQWHRAVIGWRPLADAVVNGPNYDQYVSWNCSGSGTHDFRTIITGRRISGDPEVKVSNTIRATC